MSEMRNSIRLLRTELLPLLVVGALTLGSLGLAAGSRAEAKAVFDRAQAQFERGRYRSALEGYRRAYALAPLPALLYDAAQCERKLRRYADAERDYRRFLAEEPDAPNRPLVLGLIEEMHAKARLAAAPRRAPSQSAAVSAETPAEKARAAPDSPSAAPPEVASPAPQAVPATPASQVASDAPRAAALVPASSPPATDLTAPARAEAEPATPLYKKWWFWGGVAAVAAGTATAIAVASHGSPATASLGQVDLR